MASPTHMKLSLPEDTDNMQMSFIKKLIKEDFSQQFQDMIGKIAFVVNPAFQNIQSILNNGITLEDNVNCVIKSLTLSVDSTGVPTSPISFSTGLTSKVAHLIVTNCVNQTNPTVYPTGAPFISYVDNSGTLTINNITGLQAKNTFVITIVGLT
jgi:hypothetical protein